jgi:predicted nucleic acid-binding protein/predicted RNA-binding protein with PUA-like domain
MKILLDTNIIIHRETKDPINKDIGTLFRWIDKLGYQKCIHQVTLNEISSNQDSKAREAFLVKMKSYHCLPTVAPLRPEVQTISEKYDRTENDRNDTTLINELLCGRVDLLVTEDRQLHGKAQILNLNSFVFTIDEFLEKVTAENPDLLDYKVPSVSREYFGNVDTKDPFFASFKDDYLDYEKWFNSKSDETAYICKSDQGIVSFLYLKLEGASEPYADITPTFAPRRRLKIGAFKVQSNGFKLGERFLKIIFDNALHLSVEEIYVTIFPRRFDQVRLIGLLEDFGFKYHGTKKSMSGVERVYVRDFTPRASLSSPRSTFPFISEKSRKYFVPIRPDFHTSLFPDSILRTESPRDFVENEPFRNAVSKAYVSRSFERNMRSGDVLVFYRTGGYYKGVVTTLGIVEQVITAIPDYSAFVDLCRKRSVFTDDQLKEQWDAYPNKPFIVNFLYSYSFPKRINLQRLIEMGIIKDTSSVPRSFEPIDDVSFEKIIRETDTDGRLIVG